MFKYFQGLFLNSKIASRFTNSQVVRLYMFENQLNTCIYTNHVLIDSIDIDSGQ